MDTPSKLITEPLANYISEFPWLLSAVGPYLAKKCFAHRDSTNAVTLHVTDTCAQAFDEPRGQLRSDYGNRRQVYASEPATKKQLTYICGCMLKEVIEGLHEQDFARSLVHLRHLQESLDTALKPDVYCSTEHFPALTAVAVRYHRYQIARALSTKDNILSSTHEIYSNSCLEQIRKQICKQWDVAEEKYPLNHDEIIENSMRYAARYFVWKTLSKQLASIPYKLNIPIHDLISWWFSKPLKTSLIEEYFGPKAENFRKEACKVTTPSFSLKTLDALDADVRLYMKQQTPYACYIGPINDAFDTSQGPRPLLMWYGTRARETYAALGEYPDLVAAWMEDCVTQNTRWPIVSKPGGPLVRICESPSMDEMQWSLALKLWEDSFSQTDAEHTTAKEDVISPYRDWAVAIDAAKVI